MEQRLHAKLTAAFAPTVLRITNDSHQHRSHSSGESHFNVVMVSAQFEGLHKVAQHQQVYAVLAEELANGVHALALHTYSPSQWDEHQVIPASPPCAGGGH